MGKSNIRRLTAAVLAGSGLWALAGEAWAHQPFFDDGTHTDAAHAFPLPDIEVSRVLYVDVPCPDRPVWLTFEAAAGASLYVQLGTPVMEEIAEYRPSLALVGPGLPAAPPVPWAVPEGLGAVVFSTKENRDPPVFHEPFTQTDSWILLEKTISLEKAGTYYIVAWSDQHTRARLWVATGTREELGPSNVADPLGRVKAFHDPETAPDIGEPCDGAGAVVAGGGCAMGAPRAVAGGAAGALALLAAAAAIAAAGRRMMPRGDWT
ncbi:MAG: hypothetical protein IT372_33035 [Polyangiaceae bacterium]|nr:hypothetical protein [Polyangiaceae bacterium]